MDQALPVKGVGLTGRSQEERVVSAGGAGRDADGTDQ